MQNHWIKATEPRGKLDTTLITDEAASALPAASASVNGPEGEDLDWTSIDWRRVEEDVRRLRQRIFTASQAGDLKKVRNLQKLMLRSRANTLLSVRRVTRSTLDARRRESTEKSCCSPSPRPHWPTGSSSAPDRGLPSPSSGCSSPNRGP
ncbi:reverse transcriptase N-terminal domain-containing protein [Actinomadura vinacea]|uniref:reverse transcriptase N-terminal domain-containing protein n=1 Tax=Actinomadura vinacea TaxID=115336 RepID=UPI003CD07C32